MKCIILAGGYGTRLAEETKIKPKPLVKIGSKPISILALINFSIIKYTKVINNGSIITPRKPKKE